MLRKIYQWFKVGDRVIHLEYSLLTLLILFPLFKPGYVLALDMVFTPKIPLPPDVNSYYLIGLFLHFLNYVIPSQIIEKTLLFLVIFLAGVGMHRLIPTKSEWPKYFGAIFYIFNPFTYSRFMYGQILLLIAYALMPFFAKASFELFAKPNLKKVLKVILFLTLIGMVSTHSILFAVILFGVALIFFLAKNIREWKWVRQALIVTILISFLFLILSSYWLIPFVSGKTTASQVMAKFDKKHIIEFKTASDPRFGVLFNVAAMYGFWGDREPHRYILPKAIIPGWYIIFGFLFALILWGLVSNYRDKEKRGFINIFTVTGLVAFVLAVGVAHPLFAKLFWFLIKIFPPLKGFRDSQKFVALLILSYGYLGALGVDTLLAYFKNWRRAPQALAHFLPTLLLILPLIYTPLMFWGFGGQLKATDYPKDWYETNRMLNKDEAKFKVLFLPWHQYVWLDFAGKAIANPAKDFFDKPVIQGDNMEFGQIYTQVDNPVSKYIERNIVFNSGVKDVGKKLKPLKVKYVLRAKSGNDYPYYDFLDHQKDLRLIKETKNLKAYLNEEF